MKVKRQRASRAKDVESIRWDRVDISKELLESKNIDNMRRLARSLKVVSNDLELISRELNKAAVDADTEPDVITSILHMLGMSLSRVECIEKVAQNIQRDPTGAILDHMLKESERSAVRECREDAKMRTKYGW